jgi:hypothetical protein
VHHIGFIILIKFKHSVCIGVAILFPYLCLFVYNGVGRPSAFWKMVFECWDGLKQPRVLIKLKYIYIQKICRYIKNIRIDGKNYI